MSRSYEPDKAFRVDQPFELIPLTERAAAVWSPELRGKVILLKFWATWCPPCRASLPHLEKLLADLEADREADQTAFAFLPIACDEGTLDQVRPLVQDTLRSLGVALPVYDDPDGRLAGLLQRGGIRVDRLPTTVLLDRQGRVRQIWFGFDPRREEKMKQRIRQLLNEPS